MSLSKQIIFKSDDDVAGYLQDDVILNEVDEYGYTPLIQTAIVNSVSKARLLLDAGAEVDFTDLTGRTALYWAADNDNYELCSLLLQRGANSNAYTSAGQPLLAVPLLRNNNKIKQLLIQHGAKLWFAQDFINAKLLGHRFELEGRVDIVDINNTFIEVELEGFYLEFSLDVIIHSLHDFRWNFAGKHLKKYFASLDSVIKTLKVARELLKYQHYLIDVNKYAKKIDRLLDNEPLLIPVAYAGHAVSFIKFFDEFIRCDRGEFGRKHGAVVYYNITNLERLNKTFVRQLIYKRQYKTFIDDGMLNHLGLTPRKTLPLLSQKVGNCSWANIEAAIPALMLLLGEKEQNAMQFYREWLAWEQNRALHFCIQSFHESKSEARKAAKAALLAAILFQRCDYQNPQDQERANRILPILTNQKFRYILKSYQEVFSQDSHNTQMKNLRNFLEDFGVAL